MFHRPIRPWMARSQIEHRRQMSTLMSARVTWQLSPGSVWARAFHGQPVVSATFGLREKLLATKMEEWTTCEGKKAGKRSTNSGVRRKAIRSREKNCSFCLSLYDSLLLHMTGHLNYHGNSFIRDNCVRRALHLLIVIYINICTRTREPTVKIGRTEAADKKDAAKPKHN